MSCSDGIVDYDQAKAGNPAFAFSYQKTYKIQVFSIL